MDERSLISLDAEAVREMVKHVPAKQRRVMSKAILAAAEYSLKTFKDYDKALELSLSMVENEWRLGVELNRLFEVGDMGRGDVNNFTSDYGDFSINRMHGLLVRSLASRKTIEECVDLARGTADRERKILARLWSLKGAMDAADQLPTPPAPKGKYSTIVIDPPWPVEKIALECRPDQQAFDYATMDEATMADLAIPMADDCHVWLWTTHKFLPTALRLLTVWDLKYVCTFVWHKANGFQPFGLPKYNCEFALYARRGAPKFVTTKAFNLCFEAPSGAHSVKPEEFYDLIRRVTEPKRLDMFNRRKIKGFTGWGHERSTK